MVRRHCSRAKVIYDTVDLHHLREAREAELRGDKKMARKAEDRRHQELKLVEEADVTFVVSQAEKAVLQDHAVEAVVEIVPTIYEVHKPTIPFELRKHLLFIGGFDHMPNSDAVLYFAREIFPLVQQRLQGTKLYVVGNNPRDDVQALASRDIVVTGYVPDVSPFFKCTRVFIAPLRFGAGISGKIHQSLSHGLPVVSTALAADGLKLQHEVTALIANNAREFADATVSLYNDRDTWEKLSANGLRHVETQFSVDVVRKDLARILGVIAPYPGKGGLPRQAGQSPEVHSPALQPGHPAPVSTVEES